MPIIRAYKHLLGGTSHCSKARKIWKGCKGIKIVCRRLMQKTQKYKFILLKLDENNLLHNSIKVHNSIFYTWEKYYNCKISTILTQ